MNMIYLLLHCQAVEFSTNPLDDDVTGLDIVYFRGQQNHTVNTKINMA